MITDTSHTTRSISFHAVTELSMAGYQCIRVAGPSRPFDLIAWKEEKILFIAVRRTRSEGISRFTGDVSRLTDLVKTRTPPGVVYLWIYLSNHCFRYRILPGGAFPVKGEAIP
ncbi:MAG: hypothetical protein LUQ50_15565 [Methanospirillum sp.]|uniref:hypothetical protein n=1 Tax=Methanospirillum sp. TaxID=45200 RepID=UPI00236F53C5|nr:hypothetical protein [Methanospirillum sp.]MDD1730472.1 hypothetical protein [Methanospirillum sp.]